MSNRCFCEQEELGNQCMDCIRRTTLDVIFQFMFPLEILDLILDYLPLPPLPIKTRREHSVKYVDIPLLGYQGEVRWRGPFVEERFREDCPDTYKEEYSIQSEIETIQSQTGHNHFCIGAISHDYHTILEQTLIGLKEEDVALLSWQPNEDHGQSSLAELLVPLDVLQQMSDLWDS